jgi:hypothetical protein
MTKQQMELGLDHPLGFRRAVRRQRRQTRARWWFAQMRQVVSDAPEAGPANSATPEQTALTLGTEATQTGLPRPFDLN